MFSGYEVCDQRANLERAMISRSIRSVVQFETAVKPGFPYSSRRDLYLDLPLVSHQELNSWFLNDFLPNKKLEAVRQFSFDDGIGALNINESPERRLLASLCYDFGRGVASRFFLLHNIDHKSENVIRKAAHGLLWSALWNLQPYAALKVEFGSRSLKLRSACFNMVSLAISNTRKTTAGVRARSSAAFPLP